MHIRLRPFLVLVSLSFVIAACATGPGPASPERIATAKRFLHSWGAGEITMASFRRSMEARRKTEPGVTELVRRAFAGTTANDFEDIAARIYARHLSQGTLEQLADFTDSPSGNRFFRISIRAALTHQDTKTMVRQLSADDLAAGVKFGQSDAFKELKRELPTINQELAEEGRRFGQERMRAYLNRQ